MRFVHATLCAAAVCGAIAFAAAPAGAEETGSLASCTKLADDVKQALATNTQSAGYGEAMKEKGYGRDFCANGLYGQGVAHYDEALRLLGAEKG